jgi:hypothetical protein
MWHMNATPEALQRLGALVAGRRAELRLERRPAARLAGISNTTWKRVEEAHSVRDVSYAAMEPVLRWAYGSCLKILAGGEPTPIADDDSAPPSDPEPTRELIAEGDGYQVFRHVPADDLRDAVRSAAIAVIPGTTGAEIQEMERIVEEELRKRLERRGGN